MRKKLRAVLARSFGGDSPLPSNEVSFQPRKDTPSPSASSSIKSSQPLPTTIDSNKNTLVFEASQNVLLDRASVTLLSKFSENERTAFEDASKSMDMQDLLSNVREYDLEHKNDSSFRPQEKRLSKLLDLLSRFMGIVAVIPSPEISIMVGSFKIVIELALKFTTFFSKLSDMICKFQDFMEPLLVYAQVRNKLVEEAIVKVYTAMLEFGWKARRVFVTSNGVQRKWTSLRVFIRQQWDDFESEFESIEMDMKHHLNVLMHTIHAHQFSGLATYYDERQRTEKRKERMAFLSWISNIDFEDVHQKIYAKRNEQTCNWLLQEPKYQNWFNSPTSSLLWCYGKPGIGKSVLASFVLEHLTAKRGLEQKTAICFVYYDYEKPHLGNMSLVIAAIIKQICRKSEYIPRYLLNLKYEGLGPSSSATQETFALLLEEYSQAFLVFDALDECREEERESLLRFITEIVTLQFPCAVKVFVTSRREMDIARAFELEHVPTVPIKADSVAADIRTFTRSQVEKLRTGKHGKTLYIKSDELAQKIIETLTMKADGMFLWVKLQLDNLCQFSKAHNDQQVEDALDKLPKDLQNTYFRIMEQIDNKVSNLRELALNCLAWITHARWPLRTEELREALAVHPNCKSRRDLKHPPLEVILEACGNLLEESNGVIRPIHYTVQEFLSGESVQEVTDRSIRAQVSDSKFMHTRLSLVCLWYMHIMAFDEAVESAWDLVDLFKVNFFALYAYPNFDFHISQCGEICPEIIQQVEKFLRQDKQYLAAALQIIILKPELSSAFYHDRFINNTFPVSASSIIYCTWLYNVSCLKNQWASHTAPQYALHLASSAGLIDAVSALIEAGYNVYEKDTNGFTPLSYATTWPNLKVAEKLLQKMAEHSNPDDNLNSALRSASASGQEQMVKLLLDYHADVNAQDDNSGTALSEASYAGEVSIVKLLLERGADVNAQGEEYGNALQEASCCGSIFAVELLLDWGVDVNAQGGEYGNALQAASTIYSREDDENRKEFRTVVKLLLDWGAKINAQGGKYGNALQAAAHKGSTSLVELLLDRGADINAQGGIYGNALQGASVLDSEKEEEESRMIVELLLERGANINAQGGKYGNALQGAAASSSKSIVELLLSRGAYVNAQGGYYGTALQAGSLYDPEEECETVVKLLLNWGADVNVRGGEYGTALEAASSLNSEGYSKIVVQLLLERGAAVSAQCGYYGNALQAAASSGHKSVVKVLIDWGADISKQGRIRINLKWSGYFIAKKRSYYGCALQAASYFGHKSVVELLVCKGADIFAPGERFCNAVHAASYGEEKEVKNFLLDYIEGTKCKRVDSSDYDLCDFDFFHN